MSVLSELLKVSSDRGELMLAAIEQTATTLAQQMRTAHGGEWRIDISHDANAQYVMVCRRGKT